MNNLNHLGEFKVIGNDKKYDSLFFGRYTSVDFILDKDIVIKIEGGLIHSISYTPNGNMVISLVSFNPFLYDSMISGNKINTIRIHELKIDLKDTGCEIECESTYHNFEFENYSTIGNYNDEKYIYVLKGI